MTTRTSSISTAAGLLLMTCGAAPAFAQGYDADCLDAVKSLCGDTPLGTCFEPEVAWTRIPAKCEGDVQSMIEDERDALASDAPAATDLPAISYGGILRSGPGMEFKKKASLREGQPLEVLEATGTWMGDYQWFKVRSSSGTGFTWGGIFCSEGGKPEGVLSSCADYPPKGR